MPDGNYVYNGEFQQGADRLEYWIIDSDCEGAKISVTNENNIREMKAEIPESVSGLEQVKLVQENIALTAGKEYVLSFDGYADQEKTIIVRVAGQDFEFDLSEEKQSFKCTVKTGDTLEETDLSVLMGTAGTLWLDNIRIQENTLLINGDFSNGMTGYEVYAYTQSDVSYVVDALNEDNAFSIDISDTGDMDWKIQLKQNNLVLENGKWYKISFDAKSTMDRRIMYALQRDGSADDNWIPYSGTQKIDITNAFQTFETVFQMSEETDTATILSISMGAVDGIQISEKHTVVIDNIILEEVEAVE